MAFMTNDARDADAPLEAVVSLGARREPGLGFSVYEYRLTLAYDAGRPSADVERRRVRRRGARLGPWGHGPVPPELDVVVNVALAARAPVA